MTHYQILMDIINYPKPHRVLVEKPLCTTVMDCKKVVEAAKKRPEMLGQVGLEYRYLPPVAKLIEIVKDGTLGHIKMVAIREHRFPFLVKVNNWNRFNCNSGGTLVEKCCHFFVLLRLFASANPVCVMASGGVDVNHKDEIYDGKIRDFEYNLETQESRKQELEKLMQDQETLRNSLCNGAMQLWGVPSLYLLMQ